MSHVIKLDGLLNCRDFLNKKKKKKICTYFSSHLPKANDNKLVSHPFFHFFILQVLSILLHSLTFLFSTN